MDIQQGWPALFIHGPDAKQHRGTSQSGQEQSRRSLVGHHSSLLGQTEWTTEQLARTRFRGYLMKLFVRDPINFSCFRHRCKSKFRPWRCMFNNWTTHSPRLRALTKWNRRYFINIHFIYIYWSILGDRRGQAEAEPCRPLVCDSDDACRAAIAQGKAEWFGGLRRPLMRSTKEDARKPYFDSIHWHKTFSINIQHGDCSYTKSLYFLLLFFEIF